jgi:hypothetical protein
MECLRGANGAEKVTDGARDALRFKAVEDTVAVPALGNKVRALEDGEMSRNGRT